MASAQEANPAPDLSVVIPVYNEAHRIGESVATVAAWLRSRIEAGTLTAGEIVVVSDGSHDDPGARLTLGSDGGVETRFIEFPENRGKGAAVRAGVLAATGRTILFSDADLATPIEESTKLERALDEGADLAIASRRVDDSDIQVEQSTSRQLTGGLFPRVVRLLTGLRHADTQCGFKMFRAAVAPLLFEEMQEERFAFDVELLCAAREHHLTVAEVGVIWRDSGETTVRLWRDPLRMATTLLRLADPQRFPRVFARQLGLATILATILLAFLVGATEPASSEGAGPTVARQWSAVVAQAEGDSAPALMEAATQEGLPAFSLLPLALSRNTLGETETATRLPTLFAALLLLALVFRIARCEGGRELAALATWITGISYLTLSLFGFELFDLLSTLSIIAVWGGVQIAQTKRSSRPALWMLLALVSAGFSVFFAGPIAAVLWLGPLACFAGRGTLLRFGGVAVVAVVGAVAFAAGGSAGDATALVPPPVLRIALLAVAPGLLFLIFSGRTARGSVGARLFAEPNLRAWGLSLFLPVVGLFVAQGIASAGETGWLRALSAHSAGGILASIVPAMALIASLAIRASLDRAVTFPMRIALFGGTWALLVGGSIALFFVRPDRFDGRMGIGAAFVGALVLIALIARTGPHLDREHPGPFSPSKPTRSPANGPLS